MDKINPNQHHKESLYTCYICNKPFEKHDKVVSGHNNVHNKCISLNMSPGTLYAILNKIK